MLETLLGSALGILSRSIPEVLKWLDRKNERKHEQIMQDKQIKFEEIRGAQRMQEISASADAAWNSGALTALAESVKAQGQPSGVKWADALSVSVRPVITYWFMLLYCVVKVATFWSAIEQQEPVLDALYATWTTADTALFAGIINFWFLGRVFDKVK